MKITIQNAAFVTIELEGRLEGGTHVASEPVAMGKTAATGAGRGKKHLRHQATAQEPKRRGRPPKKKDEEILCQECLDPITNPDAIRYDEKNKPYHEVCLKEKD